MFSFLFFGVFSALAVVFLRLLHPGWYAQARVRRALFGVLLFGLLGILLRMVGKGWLLTGGSPTIVTMGAVVLATSGVIILGLILSLPAAALVRVIGRAIASRAASSAPAASEGTNDAHAVSRSSIATGLVPTESAPMALVPTVIALATPAVETPPTEDAVRAARDARIEVSGPAMVQIRRRNFIELSAAALPVAAVGAGLVGVAQAFEETALVERKMRFEGLPASLRGLRILQLTDLHIGAFLSPSHVRDLVERAASLSPDMVVITGDFCDHLPSLEPALREVLALRPKLGTFAVLGNHEHFGGGENHRRIYEKVGIDMLVDEHRSLVVGDRTLTLAGVDDPVRRGSPRFYESAIERALSGAPSDAFSLAMCHRPSGFDALAGAGIDLTLSGHTHGAQMGSGERSVFEGSFPETRLWGRYAIGNKQLYTSSGGGHWFAFRIGCPSEAPLVVLTG